MIKGELEHPEIILSGLYGEILYILDELLFIVYPINGKYEFRVNYKTKMLIQKEINNISFAGISSFDFTWKGIPIKVDEKLEDNLIKLVKI